MLSPRAVTWAWRRGLKIYTRTGDAGTSSLFSGERRIKADRVFMALGDTDELNASIGLARSHVEVAGPPMATMLPQLDSLQSRLLDVGSAIATPLGSSSEARLQRTAFEEGVRSTQQLEEWIDAMDAELPTLRNFILPSGGAAAASLHVARAVCRRAERSVTPLCLDGECDPAAAVFLNRLSDYLFVGARFAALRTGGTEIPYQKGGDSGGGA